MTKTFLPEGPKLREAVALAYRDKDAAPRIIAKGKGLIADEILSRAKDHGVYVHQSPELLSLLMQVDLDQHIPAELYAAVAELLAWLYRMEHGVLPEVNPAENVPRP